MASSNHLAVFISSLLLLSLAFPSIASHEENNKSEVVIEGMVYCQSCEYNGTQSLSKAIPIPSAKVNVTCTNVNNQISFNKVFEADGGGYYFAELKGFQMSHSLLDHPMQSCRVKLVSSPDENCNIPTDVNNGIEGSPLRYEGKRLTGEGYDAVIYAAGPVAFRPAQCLAPSP
ncbi:Pollen Ole e 1 allergen/extensin [Corchorus olitorius]|uniref:Pollen Ole e 1 allergen/extensin n=1 Tax=Corchorus olitorius TaxID=93759 RepID=A0A1R3I1W7_9ROSI|nr:Pollen Ole e 1 allergen/extensin [Corchorus olitorius]